MERPGPLPDPPPHKARSRASSTRYGGRGSAPELADRFEVSTALAAAAAGAEQLGQWQAEAVQQAEAADGAAPMICCDSGTLCVVVPCLVPEVWLPSAASGVSRLSKGARFCSGRLCAALAATSWACAGLKSRPGI